VIRTLEYTVHCWCRADVLQHSVKTRRSLNVPRKEAYESSVESSDSDADDNDARLVGELQ